MFCGGVKYLDLESSTSIEFGYGFQVRLPCRLRKQAIEHAKKLPPVLQLSQLPPGNQWESLFQNGYPDFQDIALYILPVDNIKRLKDNYTSLLDLMEKKQSAMRTSVDGAELLLFTSNQLPVKSKGEFSVYVHSPDDAGDKIYLRRLSVLEKETPTEVPGPSCSRCEDSDIGKDMN
ncbi:hypothetical protein ACFE04_007572 [Oxalis oulophora]